MALYRNIGNVEQPKTGFEDQALIDVYTDPQDTGWNIPRPRYVSEFVEVSDLPYPADDIGREYEMLYPVPDERPVTPPVQVTNTAIVETPEDPPSSPANIGAVLTLGSLLLVTVTGAGGKNDGLIFGSLLALLAYRLNK